MRPLVGVLPRLDQQLLKQHLLLCDQLAYAGLEEWKEEAGAEEPSLTADIEWLQEQGLIFDPRDLRVGSAAALSKGNSRLEAEFRQTIGDFINALMKPNNGLVIHDHLARALALFVREGMNVDAVALTQVPTTIATPDVTKADVLQVVFENLPVPNESCSIEEILDFAREAREQNLVQGLRVFITELACGGLTTTEVRDKLDHLIAEHSRALRLHQRVVRRGVLETIVVASAEVITSLKAGHFADAARAMVGLTPLTASLLLEEMGLPGREVAYLVNTRDHFKA